MWDIFVGQVRQNLHFPADFGQFIAGGQIWPPPPSKLRSNVVGNGGVNLGVKMKVNVGIKMKAKKSSTPTII